MCDFISGLYIQSEIPLLEPLSGAGKNDPTFVDVKIRYGKRVHLFDQTKVVSTHRSKDEVYLHWDNIGSFWLRAGEEVIVEPTQNVAESLLRSVLLGPVLAMLLVQRGQLVLHASAVSLESSSGITRAIAFLGHSTHGKSTMAAAMFKKGHRLLADDTIAVPTGGAQNRVEQGSLVGRPLIHPAIPHFKLRAPSLEALDEMSESLVLWHPDDDNYAVSIAENFPSEPAPLECLYVLRESDSTLIEQLTPEEALTNLLDYSYCARALSNEQLGDDFLKCAELARLVPVFRLQRPKDFGRLPEVIQAVEEHQAELAHHK